MESIPVVDFGPISNQFGRIPSKTDWELVTSEIDGALSQIGFVYLKNHGIPQGKIDCCFEESRKFFELDTEVKVKYLKDIKISNTGYALPNQEQLDPSSTYEHRESFDITTNYNTSDPIRTPEAEVPHFGSSILELKNECRPLLDKLHRILAKGLKLKDEEYFIKKNQFLNDPTVQSITTFRTLYYPAIPETMEIGSGTVRCAAHSDYGTITLLFQDNIGGLEVKNAKGAWVQASPIPGTILINTGDLLYFWSGGRYPATVHRVLIPESEIKKRVARQSIAYFVHPDDNVMVFPLNSPNVGVSDGTIKSVLAVDHAMTRIKRSYAHSNTEFE